MKQKFFIASIITLLSFYSSYSQVKAYAYSQTVLSGARPKKIVDEKGNQTESRPSSSMNYLFYLEYKNSTPVTPTAIWFKDRAYSVKVQQVKTTPVEMVNSNIPGNPQRKTLVPATKDKVVLVQPDYSKKISFKPVGELKKLLATSELVFVYTYKGKRRFMPIKTITILEPVATQ